MTSLESLRFVGLGALALALAACGGSSDSGDTDTTATTPETTEAAAPAETDATAPAGSFASLEGKVATGGYVMDKGHGYVTFTYNHLGFSNPRLRFRDIDATLALDAEDPANSGLEVKIAANSIDTGVDVFDEHMNSSDWLDTEQFPTITFFATSMAQTADGAGTVTGDLTIKDVTKEVTLDVELLAAGEHPLAKKDSIGINATATVLRSDFGLGGYAPNVSDEVEILISAEFNKSE